MKRIVFLIIASLLVLGLVLPGCGDGEEPEFDQYITFAVTGPMDDRQGEHHWAGAEMARDEINDDGGVDVGGTIYGIALEKVDTNEVHGTPSEGVNALTAVIADVDFVIGGFRTESVVAYREVAMDAKKMFLNCGAATASLQGSVFSDYPRYKYWFKATPYNEVFLCTSLLKMTATIGGALKATLEGTEAAYPDLLDPDYEVSSAVGGKLRVAIIAEALTWCEGIVDLAEDKLPLLGYNVTITQRPSATATDITTELNNIAATKPHIIFTVFSGPVGLTYSKQRAALEIPALSLGINVEGQSKGAWYATSEGCQYDIMLDTWAENMSVTPNSVAWFNDFVTKVGDYPLYNGATYDAINTLKVAIEAEDSLNATDLIPYLETHSYEGVGANTAYFPAATINLGGGTYALTATQAYALYGDGLLVFYDYANFAEMAGNWTSHVADWTTLGGHIIHDTVYGPGYQTGIGSQWQDGAKVGIWPMVITATGANKEAKDLTPGEAATLIAAGVLDRYGNWNFQYPGKVDVYLPIEWFYA